jgi:ubiquinone/menaquinone biosynthesis C-methylase UbiE
MTVPEAQRMLQLLQIRPGEVLADLACGAGGPACGWRRSLVRH